MKYQEEIMKLIFSLGFLKWIWDGICFVVKRYFLKKITLNIEIAYRLKNDSRPSTKIVFLTVRNNKDTPCRVVTFVTEDGAWHRFIPRKNKRKVHYDEEIMKIPANGAMQMGFTYSLGNLINPKAKYFGVGLSKGKTIWLSRRKWKAIVNEYTSDFPDWHKFQQKYGSLQFVEYQRSNQNAESDPRE